MALVCDVESNAAQAPVNDSENQKPPPDDAPTVAPEGDQTVPDNAHAASNEEMPPPNEDLEDGEIEDDGDDEVPVEPEKPKEPEPPKEKPPERHERSGGGAVGGAPERPPRHERRRHEEKKKHMTEAEKSILHLRKRERLQREKWEKYRKEQNLEAPIDDFASNIEKAIASVLKKDKHISDEEKEEDRRMRGDRVDVREGGRKRKGRDGPKERGGARVPKQRRLDLEEESDEKGARGEVGGGTPPEEKSPTRSEDSYDSEYSSDGRVGRREFKRKGRNRDQKTRKRSRERRPEPPQPPPPQLKDQQGVCVFFLQGKCQKNDCPYSHEAMPPMKLELCKFYLKDCCAKGDKCSYMHGEFPCKFYHTGLVCLQGDACKFAHGGPLDEHRRQILFKHIETAPREILGGFPRMSREEALNKINIAQQTLVTQYGAVCSVAPKPQINVFDINVPPPPEAAEKPKPEKRNRPSRWQDPEPVQPFVYQDQDMRISSNGDVDMRTLPPLVNQTQEQENQENENFTKDIDIRNPNMLQFDVKDVDIRQDPRVLASKDVDIRQIPVFEKPEDALPADLPKTQRDLFLRIQSQQKPPVHEPSAESLQVDDNINWYSDDDDEDENRLTIKVDNEDEKKDEEIMSPPQQQQTQLPTQQQIKPQEVVEKLGDLSKIDISAEVTKLLTSMSQQKEKTISRDPRQQRAQAQEAKISIYEQGSIGDEPKSPDEEVVDELRSRPDVDLRNLQLPFKGMLNYTPAKEIDASVNSHPPIPWKVEVVDIPRPDYTGLKLNIQDAEKTGDPRLKKIFRLSTEEKDSPASPKASPKASTRIDPRLKKIEESKQDNLTYNQQLNILQSSAFFQSLTSNQKLLLNQELASRGDQTGINDPLLNSMLTTLNLIPNSNINMTNPSLNTNAALNILANVNKLNTPTPIVMRPMVQPGLLGAAPGIPNIPEPFQPPPMAAFDPRAMPNQFQNFPEQNFGGFDDYYQEGNFGGGRENRGFNRDRRRGRNNFNRNNGNRNFRNRNRNNRGHTPP